MIDIIIPAWNCATTLERTLKSVIEQSVSDLSVIVVDDNNKNNDVKKICEQYSSVVKYIRNDENKGCGGSRQIGYDNSNSEYIYFLDADDIMLPGVISSFKNIILEQQPDYIYLGFQVEKDNGTFGMFNQYQSWVHGMFYRREFLDKYKIRFDNGHSLAEDTGFNIQVYELADSSIYIRNPAVLWCNNPQSITRSNKNYLAESFEDYIDEIVDAYTKIGLYKSFEKCKLSYAMMSTIAALYKRLNGNITAKSMNGITQLFQFGFRPINQFWFIKLIEEELHKNESCYRRSLKKRN